MAWKHGLWDDVSIVNPVLSWEKPIIDIYSPLQSACGEKILFTAGIPVMALSPCSVNGRAERHRVLPLKITRRQHIYRIICLSKHSCIECEKPIIKSSWRQCSINDSFSTRVLSPSKGGQTKCLGSPLVNCG
ncbi:hypothetical protein TNCV_2299481 [Trichonephila clavipes]|nr:hypothetical protein TNCV_2299481 [Trichonephila clavipes]